MAGTESVDWPDLFRELASHVLGRINVCTPATVVTYDPTAGVATVQPAIGFRHRSPGGSTYVDVPSPIIGDVRVCWPVWGGQQLGIVGQLVPGDDVTLVVSDRSLDEWKAGAAEAASGAVFPKDVRRLQLTDCFAIVGGLGGTRTPPSSLPNSLTVAGPTVLLGDSSAVDPVVTESRLMAELSRLYALLEAHTHLSAAPGSPTGTMTVSTPPTVLGSPGPLSSPTIKAP